MENNATNKLTGGDELREGMLFDSLAEAEDSIKKWVTRIGFEIKRGHSKKGIMRKYSFSSLSLLLQSNYLPAWSSETLECSRSRKRIEKCKSDPLKKRSSSKRTDCPWHINLRSNKSIAPSWRVTTFCNEHNHEFYAQQT
jgi:FAR1 DNA-binding domain